MSDAPASSPDSAHDGSPASGSGPGAAHGLGHLVPTTALVATGLGLLFLTWITVVVAGIDLGEANIYIALGIAAFKGTLVALFFMHLRWDRPFNGIILVGSICFVALFLALAMTDTAEYQDSVIPGDSRKVVEKLAEYE